MDDNRIKEFKFCSDYLKATIMICHDQEPLNFDLINCSFDFDHPQLALNPFRGKVGHYEYFNVNDKVLLCHSELNSAELEKFEHNGCIGVYYWSHALIARDWFRYAQYEKRFVKHNNPVKTFLIYNRSWSGTREYRLYFTQLLVENNLIPYCNAKFNAVDQEVHYKNHVFTNPELKISNFDLENFLPPNYSASNSSADFDIDDYLNSSIEIVLETLVDDNRHQLTEKILRPIACAQPFVLVSTAGSLKYLQQYGFETFGNIIDESYDQEPNPALRLKKIIELMKKILTLTSAEKSSLKEIAKRNQQRFFSNEFHQQIVNEFAHNYQLGLIEMHRHCNASFLKLYQEKNPNFWKSGAIAAFADEQEYLNLLSWVDTGRFQD